MKKVKQLTLLSLLLVMAQGVWAAETEGPWTYDAVKYGCCAWNENLHIAFNGLNNTSWGTPSFWNDADGIGFTVHGTSIQDNKNCVFSTYYHSESVPAYTRKVLTWNYYLRSLTSTLWQRTSLYARESMTDLKATQVDFTRDMTDQSGAAYRLSTFFQTTSGTPQNSELQTKTFDFDNRNGSATATKQWNLLLTHVVESKNNSVADAHNWGSFLHSSSSWTTYYYKHVTFDANGGSGSMSVQTVENSGNLTANAFTREGYVFDGWATSADGSVEYADGATINATESSKGPVTLYAQWTPINYTISYDLGGGSVATENPTAYTIESAAFTLNNPTKEGYTFAGWTGTDLGSATQTVTIAAGSMGNRSYSATWYNNDDVTAAAEVDALISAICSPVQYTEACVTAINAARAAYDDLSADGKALVANLAALTTAEAELDEADEAMAWAANEDTDHAGDYYSTFYHSAVRYSLPEGTEAYIATLSSDALNLTRIAVAGDVIPEDNAVILKGNSSSITLTPSLADPVSVDPAQNSLQGEDGVTDTPANCYVLSGRSSDNTVTGVGFYKYEGEKIPAHKAFVVISNKANSPKRLRFVFNETNTATGVEQVEGQNGTEPVESTKELRDGQFIIIKNGVKYNAQGQMVK